MATPDPTTRVTDDEHDQLGRLVLGSRRLVVLTGAGVSTESGIPDYRALDGSWKRPEPIRYQAFVKDDSRRRRYWARSFLGWPRFRLARPGPAHEALARLEAQGRVHYLITQNVDELHQRAGSEKVIDLHGRLSRVVCLGCRAVSGREDLQRQLAALNPEWAGRSAPLAPDGDADLELPDMNAFQVPACPSCGGILKPDVVFFGENVPAARVEAAVDRLTEADALLVAGSSLMVRSGYRFAVLAAERAIPIAIVNQGRTRADDLVTVKIEAACGEILKTLAR